MFNSIDNAADACREISSKFDGYSSLYKYNNKFYLMMYFSVPSEKRIFTVMSEFGTEIDNCNIMVGRLNEYGEPLIKEKAVYALSVI